MSQAIDALLNAARLKGLDSPANGNLLASLAPSPNDTMQMPDGSHAPISGSQFAADSGRYDQLLRGLDTSSPAMRAARDQQGVRQYAEAADLNDLASGVPQELAVGQQSIKNAVGDKAAAGEYMPFTQQLHDRTQAEKSDFANTQYVLPSMMKAQADLQGHQIDAQGRVAAAQAGHPDKSGLDYFRQAVAAAFGKGLITKPEDLVTLAQQLGVKQ